MSEHHLYIGARAIPDFTFALRFEVQSLIGRAFLGRKPPLRNGYCNLGCGDRIFENYCNADFFRIKDRIIDTQKIRLDWEIDMRYPLKCEDDLFKGIFSEHAFEHVSIFDGRRLLREIYRIMRPKGILRLTVPSLEKYVDFYSGGLPHEKFSQWSNRGEALWSLTHNYRHKSVYDFDLLKALLVEAKFTEITRCEFREGKDANLLLDSEHRAWETLYVEARKP